MIKGELRSQLYKKKSLQKYGGHFWGRKKVPAGMPTRSTQLLFRKISPTLRTFNYFMTLDEFPKIDSDFR